MDDTSRPAAPAVVASTVPDKPSLDGIEDKWTRRWEQERVVQV